MASDFLVINRQKMHGNSAVRLAELLREVQDLADKFSDIRGHMVTGSDYATLEAMFGLPAGKGAEFDALLSNVDRVLNTNEEITGANRRSYLNDFVGRVAGQ